MATIYIDNQPREIADGQNLLQALLTLGYDLPYFCWHGALGSVGSCRQCAIKLFKDESDVQGTLVMACMTPARDGTRISIDDQDARDFRALVLEWLMTSHPHDCPVCDEGGECHLQDMTVMTGHTYRRYRFKKRTFRNQDLGPFINHEMNRCIRCYRCVRFYRDYAGGRDLVPLASRDRTYFGRSKDGVLESPFSGNLVEVCPTGVFTDKPLRSHYARKWDLQTAPSICAHCGLGCNTIAAERYGTLRRILNRYHPDVNGYFLCDRGRFGYAFLHDQKTVRVPWIAGKPLGVAGAENPEPAGGAALPDAGRIDPQKALVACEEAIGTLGEILARAKGTVGIGSPRSTLENNFALRALVGADHFSGGLAAAEIASVGAILNILCEGSVHPFSLQEVAQADAVLVLGEDVGAYAPLLELSVRQAVRRKPIKEQVAPHNFPEWDDACVRLLEGSDRGPLFVATPAATSLDELAEQTLRAAPEDIARLGMAVAHELDAQSPAVSNSEDGERELAGRIAESLRKAERPVVIAGMGGNSPAVIEAAGNVARALGTRNARSGIFLTTSEADSLGAGLLSNRSVESVIDDLKEKRADTVILLENDLVWRMGRGALDELRQAARRLVVVDYLETDAAPLADLVLPSTSFADGAGTHLNNEGRLQRSYGASPPLATVRPAWRWLGSAGESGGSTLNALGTVMAQQVDELTPLIALIAEDERMRMGGGIARQSHRASGRTSINASAAVSEPKPPEDDDTPLNYSMEGAAHTPPHLINRYWAPGWNSGSAVTRVQEEVSGPLRGGVVGRRLFERREGCAPRYAVEVSGRFERRSGHGRAVGLHEIFGSEQLSARAAAVQARIPEPRVLMSADTAREIGAAEGEQVKIEALDSTGHMPPAFLPLEIDNRIPAGVVGLPCGMGGVPAVLGFEWVKLTKGERS